MTTPVMNQIEEALRAMAARAKKDEAILDDDTTTNLSAEVAASEGEPTEADRMSSIEGTLDALHQAMTMLYGQIEGISVKMSSQTPANTTPVTPPEFAEPEADTEISDEVDAEGSEVSVDDGVMDGEETEIEASAEEETKEDEGEEVESEEKEDEDDAEKEDEKEDKESDEDEKDDEESDEDDGDDEDNDDNDEDNDININIDQSDDDEEDNKDESMDENLGILMTQLGQSADSEYADLIKRVYGLSGAFGLDDGE